MISVKEARVGFWGISLTVIVMGVFSLEAIPTGFWSSIATVFAFYALLEMTSAAARVGWKGAKLKGVKTENLVLFERIFLITAIVAWLGVYFLEVSPLSNWRWSPIAVNVLTVISTGIIIKFLDIEWKLMGDNLQEDIWGIFSMGLLISLVSAFALVYVDKNSVWQISSAKITLSLGLSVLFAIISRMIDDNIGPLSTKESS